jgi:formate dehydrogenase assembly factor FdhD
MSILYTTAMMEKEFIIGYLLGQGIIENVLDIESIAAKDKAKWSLEIHSD